MKVSVLYIAKHEDKDRIGRVVECHPAGHTWLEMNKGSIHGSQFATIEIVDKEGMCTAENIAFHRVGVKGNKLVWMPKHLWQDMGPEPEPIPDPPSMVPPWQS